MAIYREGSKEDALECFEKVVFGIMGEIEVNVISYQTILSLKMLINSKCVLNFLLDYSLLGLHWTVNGTDHHELMN